MKSVLQEMVRQIRGFTLELLQIDNREMYLWAPTGTSNHMLWHAGHVLWVQEVLCVRPLVGGNELPEDWELKYGQDCQPVATQSDWPESQSIHQLLSAQQERLFALLEDLKDDQLCVKPDDASDLVGGIIHGLHDEARHHGEMYLLLKQFTASMSSNDA